jgi:tetraprenyl-beta-curcumene synthase
VPAAESAFEAPMSERRVSDAGRRAWSGSPVGYLATAVVFARSAVRYWLFVFPAVGSELRHWRRSAARIRDPQLRRIALAALEKRGNMEGAAAFGAFARWTHRRDVVQALVALQAIYNHADMLAEQPSADQEDNAQRLHEVLLLALDPDAASPACRALELVVDDGGYLAEMVEACRWALSRLPGYAAAASATCSAGARIVAFQSLSLGERGELEAWALREGATDSGLEWWELAAAAGSSLPIHALIAASASPTLSGQDVSAIAAAYGSAIGALHSLLDSLVDEAEDAASGQLTLIGCYRSRREAAMRMRLLAERAMDSARGLPQGRDHALLVTAMACSYLSECERTAARTDAITREVRASLGGLARPMLLVFRLRRLAGRLASWPVARERAARSSSSPALVDHEKRGAGARAT